MSPTLGLDQAMYGSRSGDADFRILAASAGLTRDERDAFLPVANLGGSAQVADDPAPIYSFFPVDRQGRRWGWARTVFLGFGGRGNDYLVHLVVLPGEALSALRGDLFLIEELGLFRGDKPAGESLPLLPLDLEEA
jgi:hypothetical protein